MSKTYAHYAESTKRNVVAAVRSGLSIRGMGKRLSIPESTFSKHSVSAMPKSALSVALAYPLERKESLMAFLNILCATSSNQAAENMIRSFVVGRKSFLF